MSSPPAPDVIFGTTIRNPLFPYTHFKYRPDTERVICIWFSTEFESQVKTAMAHIASGLALKTPKVDNWLTTSYMELHKSDLPKLYTVIERLLSLVPFTCRIKDQTDVEFTQDDRDTPITRLFQEKRYVKQLRAYFKFVKVNQLPIHRSVFWVTSEGRALAKDIREKCYLKDEYGGDDSTTGEELEKAFDNLREDALKRDEEEKEDIPMAKKDEHENETKDAEEDDLCCVCLDQPPETRVHPCTHKVACIQCSKKMETQPETKDVCIFCRTPIKRIDIELD